MGRGNGAGCSRAERGLSVQPVGGAGRDRRPPTPSNPAPPAPRPGSGSAWRSRPALRKARSDPGLGRGGRARSDSRDATRAAGNLTRRPRLAQPLPRPRLTRALLDAAASEYAPWAVAAAAAVGPAQKGFRLFQGVRHRVSACHPDRAEALNPSSTAQAQCPRPGVRTEAGTAL